MTAPGTATPLEALLQAQIARTGPVTVAEFMALCLLHPEHGYYTTRHPIGRGGDFITAPEISQMFGEMLGLCLAQCWIDRGRPAPFCLAEIGPGRGTLMADLWRATASVPGFRAAARLWLVEASPSLRRTQADTLSGASPTWADSVADLPDLPLFLVANEFFDALPVRQFLRDGPGWRERQIGLADGGLAFGLAPATPVAALAHRIADTQPGDLVEICPSAQPIVAEIAARLSRRGGAAILVDYGGWRSLGDTLQAVHRHSPVPPLYRPGEADLTAHVDFEALAMAATACDVSAMIPQGVFLDRLGMGARAAALARGLEGSALDTHFAAYRRLTHPDEMGTLFKTIGITARGSAAIPGLSPWP